MQTEELPKGHYREKLETGTCWRENKVCPAGKKFLKQLYSWNANNPLNPMLVYKICDPCHYQKIAPPSLGDSIDSEEKQEQKVTVPKITVKKGVQFQEDQGVLIAPSGIFAIFTNIDLPKAQIMWTVAGFNKDPIAKYPNIPAKALRGREEFICIGETFYSSQYLGELLNFAENEKDEILIFQKEKDMPVGLKVGSFMGAVAPVIFLEEDEKKSISLEELVKIALKEKAIVERALAEIKEENEKAKNTEKKPSSFSLVRYTKSRSS